MNIKERSEINFVKIKTCLYMCLWLLVATILGMVFRTAKFSETTIVLLYIVAVLMTARYSNGFLWGMVASITATFTFNYFFTEPYFTFSVNNPNYVITFAVMTIVAFVTGALTSREKLLAKQAIEKENEMRVLYKLTNMLSLGDSFEKIGKIAIEQISDLLKCNVSFLYGMKENLDFYHLIQKNKDVYELKKVLGYYNKSNKNEDYTDWNVEGQEGLLGIIRIPNDKENKINGNQQRLLKYMIENIAIALDRVSASEERYKDKELMEQERYRANLLRAISHDIRTPLMGIMGTSEMIMNISDNDDPRKNLAKGIYQDADWLHSLVENILTLTRLQDGKMVLHTNVESLEEIIASAVNRIEKRVLGYEILVEIPEEYIQLPMDARLIEQVVVNLLDNAVKHTKKTEEIKIVVSKEELKEKEYQARVTVMDRGEGILDKDVPNIFQMFYTTSIKPSDSQYGIGLGLAICETVMKAHGGTITGKNRTDGKGAVFSFTLPMKGIKNHYV